MKPRRNPVALRTFALAFAVVLGPALFQDGIGCPPSGDARLEILNVVVHEEDQIAFAPTEYLYEVMLPEDPGRILVRALAMDAEAAVSYVVDDGCEMLLREELATGGEHFTLDSVPEGHSFLKILVEAPGGKMAKYVVVLARPEACE